MAVDQKMSMDIDEGGVRQSIDLGSEISKEEEITTTRFDRAESLNLTRSESLDGGGILSLNKNLSSKWFI
jgi:hypothetical protein